MYGTAIIFWALTIHPISNGIGYEQHQTSPITYETRASCQAVATEMIKAFPEHLTAYCSKGCKGTNKACRDAGVRGF